MTVVDADGAAQPTVAAVRIASAITRWRICLLDESYPNRSLRLGVGTASALKGPDVCLTWLVIAVATSPLLAAFGTLFIVFTSAVLVAIGYARGEPPRWRWG